MRCTWWSAIGMPCRRASPSTGFSLAPSAWWIWRVVFPWAARARMSAPTRRLSASAAFCARASAVASVASSDRHQPPAPSRSRLRTATFRYASAAASAAWARSSPSIFGNCRIWSAWAMDSAARPETSGSFAAAEAADCTARSRYWSARLPSTVSRDTPLALAAAAVDSIRFMPSSARTDATGLALAARPPPAPPGPPTGPPDGPMPPRDRPAAPAPLVAARRASVPAAAVLAAAAPPATATAAVAPQAPTHHAGDLRGDEPRGGRHDHGRERQPQGFVVRRRRRVRERADQGHAHGAAGNHRPQGEQLDPGREDVTQGLLAGEARLAVDAQRHHEEAPHDAE